MNENIERCSYPSLLNSHRREKRNESEEIIGQVYIESIHEREREDRHDIIGLLVTYQCSADEGS